MLEQINPNAAAIDVGSETLFVAVVGQPVRQFSTMSYGLNELREYMVAAGVKTVALEATGVYWLPIYEVLEQAGLEVCVVNGAHVKSLPGRKSDVADCQWLAQLHSHGLLRSGFVPPEAIRRLRDYQRLRQDHLEMASAHIQHMQKAMERMNVKLHAVLSQTTGASSLRMIRAIVAGERDPQRLLALCDAQVLRTKRKRVREALRGRWQPQHLFALEQALQAWDFDQQQIARCDQEIAQVLAELARSTALPPSGAGGPGITGHKKLHHNAPAIRDLHELLVQVTSGQDASQLPALTDYAVLQLISEVGTDMTRWATPKHFTAWLGLAPSSRQSGKRRRPERRHRNAAGRRFCVVARALARSKFLALGGFYRRLRATRGPRVANIATARKIAVLFYNTLRYGLRYVEQGLTAYDAMYRRQLHRNLEASARRLGFTLLPLANPAEVPG